MAEKQLYRAQVRINRSPFHSSKKGDEEIVRRISHSLINELPVEKLKQLFSIIVVDPEKIRSNREHIYLKEYLDIVFQLEMNNQVQYEAAIEI